MTKTSRFLKMNFSTNLQSSSHNSKENLPPASKVDAVPVQRATQRAVLGVLSENEQRGGRSLSQVSERVHSFHLRELYISACLWQPLAHFIFHHRGANSPNKVLSQTAPGSSSQAVHPVPAMTCTSKRLVKLFLLLLVKKWSLAAVA